MDLEGLLAKFQIMERLFSFLNIVYGRYSWEICNAYIAQVYNLKDFFTGNSSIPNDDIQSIVCEINRLLKIVLLNKLITSSGHYTKLPNSYDPDKLTVDQWITYVLKATQPSSEQEQLRSVIAMVFSIETFSEELDLRVQNMLCTIYTEAKVPKCADIKIGKIVDYNSSSWLKCQYGHVYSNDEATCRECECKENPVDEYRVTYTGGQARSRRSRRGRFY